MAMLPAWDLAQAVEQLVDLGFDGIGLTRSALEQFGTERGVELVRSSGLAVGAYQQIEFFDVVEPGRVDRPRMRHDLDVARELGAECVYALAGPRGGLPWEDAADRLVAQLGDVVAELECRGLRLAIEPIHPLRQDLSFVAMLDDTAGIVDRVGSERCGFVFDSWHVWWQRSALAVVEAHAGRLFSVQLSDHKAVTLRTLDRAQLGDGIIPLPDVVGAVRSAGYGGCLDLEIISDDNEGSYRGVLSTARARLVDLLARPSSRPDGHGGDDGLR